MANQLKIDPTRTTTLRRRFVGEMKKRFRKLRGEIRHLIIELDVFGLKEPNLSVLQKNVERQAWRFMSNKNKVQQFNDWLQNQYKIGILEGDWTDEYVHSSYKRGLLNGYIQIHKEDLAESPEFYQGSKEQFLRDSFAAPETKSKLELLYTRTYEELKGVTSAMSQQLSRELTTGLMQGAGPDAIARSMNKTILGLTRTRANVIARTETIYAHAEGQLDSYERLGVKEVKVRAEWTTAGDGKVCPLCSSLEGVVMPVKEARGLIPRHPNCRCSWIPTTPDKKQKGQIWKKRKVKQAMDKSIKKEIPKAGTVKEAKEQSRWAGKEL